jgi:hypothetical protein
MVSLNGRVQITGAEVVFSGLITFLADESQTSEGKIGRIRDMKAGF